MLPGDRRFRDLHIREDLSDSLLDRFAEFVSSGVVVFFLGKLDAALNMVSAAVPLNQFHPLPWRPPRNLPFRWQFVLPGDRRFRDSRIRADLSDCL